MTRRDPLLAPRAAAAAVLLGALLVAVRIDEVPVGAVTDDAYYVEMARSTAEGRGPVLVIGPDGAAEQPDIFPVGFPLLLAPFAALWPESLGALRVVPIIAGGVLVLLAWVWPPPGTSRGLQLALLGALALNPWFIGWSGRILSDVPHAAFVLAALLTAATGLEHNRRRRLVYAGILAGLAIALRTVGWAAALAVAATLLTARRGRDLPGFAGGVLVVLGPLWLLTGTGPLSAAYTDQMSAGDTPAWRFALENGWGYVAQLPVLLVPVFGAPVQAVMTRLHLGLLYPAAAFVAGAGLLLLMGRVVVDRWRDRAARVRVRLTVFYFLFSMAALVNFHGYPTAVQTRLLLPLLPLLLWMVLAGAWPRRRLAGVLVALMIVGGLGHNAWRVVRPMGRTANPDGSGLVDPGAGAAWVRDHAGPDAVVMTNDPLQRHIHLRRPVVPLPERPDLLADALRQSGATILLLGPSVHGRPGRLGQAEREILQTLDARPGGFMPTYSDSARAVFGFTIRR